MRLSIAPGLAALASICLAEPGSAEPLQPAGNWDVDYGDTQCTAARSYPTAAEPILLVVIPSLRGTSFQLLVSLQRQGPVFAQDSNGMVDLGAGAIASPVLYYGGKGVRLSNYQFRVPAAALEGAASASSLKFSVQNREHFEFGLTDMPAVIDALRRCTADLQQYWNANGANVRTGAKSLGNLHYTLSSADYPSEAQWKAQSGTGHYLLQIDEKGIVAGCDVLASSGVPVLDVTSCQVLKERARFSPAKDAQGRPIRSVVVPPRVTWPVSDDMFNSSCTWNLGREGVILNMCRERPLLPRPLFRPLPSPLPPPPPQGETAPTGMRALRAK